MRRDPRWPAIGLALVLSACASATGRPARERAVEARPPAAVARARPPAVPVSPPPAPPGEVRPDDGPLTAKIDTRTPAARASALRITEEARQRLAAGAPARAVELLERAVAIDARLPYPYYFLARAHADMNHPDLARRLLDRAGQKLAHEPYWKSRVEELRGTLFAAAGETAHAEAAYRRALEAWPGNRAAAQALTAASRRGKETSGGAP